MKTHAEITVTGKVQVVFYRAWVKEQAENLDLVGLARNLPDGTVKIVLEGEEENIDKLIDRCWQGPDLAEVDDVQVEWGEYQNIFDSFTTR